LIIQADDVTAATLQEISDTICRNLRFECEPTQEEPPKDLPTDVSPVIPLRELAASEICRALAALGIGERTLYRKIRNYGLDVKK
jgi:hypothetical protein